MSVTPLKKGNGLEQEVEGFCQRVKAGLKVPNIAF